MITLPIILASSVIRSNIRKRYDGGLYKVNLNNQTFEKLLDWNIEKVYWKQELGDIGIRGSAFWNNCLYCCSSEEILVFNKNFELTNRFTNEVFRGSHEVYIDKNLLYTIANQFDSILIFDLIQEKFIKGFQFIPTKSELTIFDPQKFIPERSGILHLDMIFVKNNILHFGGSQFPYMGQINLQNHSMNFIPVKQPSKWGGTHNLSFFNNGMVYCLSDENKLVYEENGKVKKIWETPSTENIIWSISSDYAKQGYVRGMVLAKDKIIVGSSPAKVMVFDLNNDKPIITVEISKDIRNSVCCLTKYEW